MMNPLLMPTVKPAPHIKALLNVGAGFDIINGTFICGMRGQFILNGGLSPVIGATGKGNQFKSTIVRWLQRRAMSRMPGSTGQTYDTEVNIHMSTLEHQVKFIEDFNGENIYDENNPRWIVTDKTMYSGTEWHTQYREYLENKLKNGTKLMVKTPFWNAKQTAAFEIMWPTFADVDSFSEFETDDVMAMQASVELGDKDANTIHMRAGLGKMRFLMDVPRLNVGTSNYLAMVVHLGKESTMKGSGPMAQPDTKLKHLPSGDALKQATNKFTYTVHDLYHMYDTSVLIDQGTKTCMYPRNANDDLRLDPDLNAVKIKNLRSKSGPSGMPFVVLVSQADGVLPSLTEFHYIKEMDKFGLEGSDRSYALSILPDVSLSRTTVRGKIDENATLRRALNITSELCQIMSMYSDLEAKYRCTPKELYDKLKSQGYDWNVLLATRGWWTINDDDHPLPFLSSMDLLNMYAGEYQPFWMTPGATTVRPKTEWDEPTWPIGGAPIINQVAKAAAIEARKSKKELVPT